MPTSEKGADPPSESLGCAMHAFDIADLDPGTRLSDRLARAAVFAPQRLYGLFRAFWPIPKWGNWAFATRFDDVQEILRRGDVFQVPFGAKVTTLNGPPNNENFVLGMQEDEHYRSLHAEVMRAFPREDAARRVAPLARSLADEILAKAEARAHDDVARLDAVEGLFTLVATRICRDYLGVDIPPEKEVEFGHWSLAMSAYMFGDPGDNPKLKRAAVGGAEQVRAFVDASVRGGRGPTIAGLLRHHLPQATDERMRVHLVGMISGFVPTNTMAAGHMLEMLLRRPTFMAAAREAALDGDDERLRRCLFEAMRFMPLNPGPFRKCVKEFTIAQGTRRATRVRPGMMILAGTHSAMFDGRRVPRPYRFDPNRDAGSYMLFGHGPHWCTGAFIAEAHIVQTFKALLTRTGLRRAPGRLGRLERLGPFPRHLFVDYDAVSAAGAWRERAW